MSGPPFLRGRLVLVIIANNARIEKKSNRIYSKHSNQMVGEFYLVEHGLGPVGCFLAVF